MRDDTTFGSSVPPERSVVVGETESARPTSALQPPASRDVSSQHHLNSDCAENRARQIVCSFLCMRVVGMVIEQKRQINLTGYRLGQHTEEADLVLSRRREVGK